MTHFLLYLLQITIISSVVAGIYLACRKRNGDWSKVFLLVSLTGMLPVTALSFFPAYEILAVSENILNSPLTTESTVSRINPTRILANDAANPINPTQGVFLIPILCVVGLIFTRLVFLGWGVFSLHRLCKRGTPIQNKKLIQVLDLVRSAQANPEMKPERTVQLIQSNEISTVATFGCIKATVLLPQNWPEWSEQQLRAVLAHELEHIERSDFLFRLLTEFVRCIHFYHPVVCWLADQFRIEQENCADLAATKQLDMARYERLLVAQQLGYHRMRSMNLAPSFSIESKSLLRRRIEMLRHRKQQAVQNHSRLSILALAILVPLTVVLCGVRVTAQSQEPAKKVKSQAEKTMPTSPARKKQDVAKDTKKASSFTFSFDRTIQLPSKSDSSSAKAPPLSASDEKTILETYEYSLLIPFDAVPQTQKTAPEAKPAKLKSYPSRGWNWDFLDRLWTRSKVKRLPDKNEK